MPQDRIVPLILEIPPSLQITEDQFFDLCQINRELYLQRNTKTGEILIMTPLGGETGEREADLIFQLKAWAKQDETGKVFSSSTGFRIPGASKDPMSPDVSWVSLERWNTLTQKQREQFPPICPDFVIELRSPSDRIESLKKKMQEWIDLGVKLGWLIDRKNRKVYLYRPGCVPECLENPETVSGDPILSGFLLDLSEIW